MLIWANGSEGQLEGELKCGNSSKGELKESKATIRTR